MEYIHIVNWEKTQHYKHRNPPWIRLYVEIIDEFDKDGEVKKFHSLPDNAKLTFVMLLCLSVRYNNNIPYKSPAWLKTNLGLQQVTLQPLVNNGYIVVASKPASKVAPKVLATEYRVQSTEADTETEYIPFKEIVSFLNQTAGTNYKYNSKKTQILIRARWAEDFKLEDFKQVISV